MVFNFVTAFDIKSTIGIKELEGGVLYGKNLKSFVGTNCNITDTLLEEGSGDAFYLINDVGPAITVTLSNNNF